MRNSSNSARAAREDPRAARRVCRQLCERAGALRAGRHLGRLPARRRALLRAAYPWLDVAPIAADYTKAEQLAELTATPARRIGFFPFDDRQLRAGRSRCVPARCRAAAAWRRLAGRRRSREGRAHAARRVQRCAGRDRAIQPEPAGAREHRPVRISTSTRSRIARSTTACGSASRCISSATSRRPCTYAATRSASMPASASTPKFAQVHDRRLPCDRAPRIRARYRVDRHGQPVQRALAAQRRRYPRVMRAADRSHQVRAVRFRRIQARACVCRLRGFVPKIPFYRSDAPLQRCLECRLFLVPQGFAGTQTSVTCLAYPFHLCQRPVPDSEPYPMTHDTCRESRDEQNSFSVQFSV